ncbi:28098_t:CDS:1, partial [Racocetra persica]
DSSKLSGWLEYFTEEQSYDIVDNIGMIASAFRNSSLIANFS